MTDGLEGRPLASLGTNEVGRGNEMDDAPKMVARGKNRAVQERRSEGRVLFDEARKEAFLDSLSCTANVVISAGEAGVDESTVYRHRRTDPEFRSGFWAAMEAACAKLAALRLQREIAREEAAAVAGRDGADLPGLDGPPDARQIADLVKLMQALRDLSRNLSGEPKPGRAPQNAGVDEMCDVLAARLKAFEKREAQREAWEAAEVRAPAGEPAGAGAGGDAAEAEGRASEGDGSEARAAA